MIKRAFTLSEFLVTLGIIGVVAALTIPTLIKNNQKKVYVTQLRKAVGVISIAVDTAMEDKHAMTVTEAGIFDDTSAALDFLKNYFKTTKTSNSNPCDFLASSYDMLSGDLNTSACSRMDGLELACATLKDGVSFCVWPRSESEGANFYIDLNGQQGPNIEGRDLFAIKVTSKGDVTGIDSYDTHRRPAVTKHNAYDRIVQDGWEMTY